MTRVRRLLSIVTVMFGIMTIGCGHGGGHGAGQGPTPSPTARVIAMPTTTPSQTATRAVSVGKDILASDDLGRTWTVAASTQLGLQGVTFVDSSNGWAVGQAGILHSTDGGRTWSSQRQPSGEDLRDVTFVTIEHGAVAGDGPLDLGAFFGAALVLVTTNGGATWTAAQLPATSALRLALLRRICLDSEGKGIAIGNTATTNVALLTTDGGGSWQDISDRFSTDNLLEAVACVGGGTIWVTASGPQIFESTDGGASWSDRSSSVESLFQGDLNALVFVDSTTAWAAGSRLTEGTNGRRQEPVLIHTTDGAATWQMRPLTAPAEVTQGVLLGLSVSATPDHGVAVGQDLSNVQAAGALGFASEDGLAWSSSQFPADTGSVFSVAIIP